MPADSRAALLPALLAAALLLALIVGGVWLGYDRGADDTQRPADRTPLDRGDLELALRNARQYLQWSEIDKAAATLEQYLALEPDDAEAHFLMAQVLHHPDRRDPAAAYDHIQRSLDLDHADPERHFFAGVLAENLDRLEDAKRHFERSIEIDNSRPLVFLHYGQLLAKMRDFEAAKKQLLAALKRKADLPEPYIVLAEIYAQSNQIDMAIDQVNKALSCIAREDKRHATYTAFKAQMLRRGNRPEDALNVLLALDYDDRSNERIVREVALCYQMMGQWSKAARVWAELSQLQPGNATAAIEAGLCYVRANRLDRARDFHRIALRLDPNHEKLQALTAALEEDQLGAR